MAEPIVYFAEGFDFVSSRAEVMGNRWIAANVGTGGGHSIIAGLDGHGKALRILGPWGSVTGYVRGRLTADLPTEFWIGFQYKPNGFFNDYILDMEDDTNGAILGFALFTDGRVGICTGRGHKAPTDGSVLAISDHLVSTSGANHLKARIVLSDTVGEVDLYVNGQLSASERNLNTIASSAGPFRRLRVAAEEDGYDPQWDDIYVSDTDLGRAKIEGRLMDSDGSVTAWTPSSAVAHHTLVGVDPVNDADYVESDTAGEQEYFGVSGYTFTGQPVAVQVRARVQVVDTGDRLVRLNAKSSGGTEDLGDDLGLTSSFEQRQRIIHLDPATGARWADELAVEATEFGVEAR